MDDPSDEAAPPRRPIGASGSREVLEREAERQRLSAVVQNSRDFIGISDLAGVPIFVNDAGMALVGALDLDEIRRTPVPDYFIAEQQAFVRDVVLPQVAAHGSWRGELSFRNFRTGAAIPVLYDVFRIDDEQSGQPAYFATVTKDITEQKRHEREFRAVAEELDRHRMLLQTVTDNATVALFITDERQHCVYMNPAAEAMTGYRLDELLDRPLHDAIHHRRPDGSPCPRQDCPFHLPGPENRQVRGTDVFVRPDGTSYDITFTASPIRQAGELRGTLIEARDTTEENRARRALEETTAERERLLADLASANAAKDEFLAMLGHELRNPLSPIVTALQLLKLRGGGEKPRELAIIERQVSNMERMVDDLLDVSRITRGKFDLRVEPVEVIDLIARAVELASIPLEQRRHRLSIDAEPGLWIHGDPIRLAQALTNLLTNAARYTERAGHVRVSAFAEGAEVVLSVTDDGAGIAPDLLPRLFDPFVQGARSPGQGGLGLGLTLVKNIVTLHGGSVTAASAGPGKGSTFRLRLPVAPAPAPRAAEHEPSLAPVCSTTGRQVLIVDDNADAAELLGEFLRSAGHDVRVATDPVSALALVDQFRPEVAVLDIGMPVMDGYELAARLREKPGLAQCPMFSLTGYGQKHDHARSRAAGFLAHLVKPVDARELAAMIDGLPRGQPRVGDAP